MELRRDLPLLIMIDLNDLRARPDAYQTAANNKSIKLDVKAFLTLDESRKKLLLEVETMRGEKNRVSKDVPKMQGDEKQKAIADMKVLGETLKQKEQELTELETTWNATLAKFPNLPLAHVPVGHSETDNVEVHTWGEKPTIDFEVRDHVAL